MHTYKIVKIKNFLKLNNKEKSAINNFLNEENRSYKSPIIPIKKFVERFATGLPSFRKKKNTYFYIFILENGIIVGGFRYYKITIHDKTLFRRFIYKNGIYFCIQSVFVLPKYRKQGLCSKLIKYFLTHVNSKYETALAVEKDNIPAIKCYTKNGFKKVIERKVTNKLVGTNNYTEYFVEYLMLKK